MGISTTKASFCRFTRNSSCPGISPQRCLAHIIAKSYHFRRSLSCQDARGNIPLIGRHLESLKKRLFLKLFYFRKNCTTKKAVT